MRHRRVFVDGTKIFEFPDSKISDPQQITGSKLPIRGQVIKLTRDDGYVTLCELQVDDGPLWVRFTPSFRSTQAERTRVSQSGFAHEQFLSDLQRISADQHRRSNFTVQVTVTELTVRRAGAQDAVRMEILPRVILSVETAYKVVRESGGVAGVTCRVLHDVPYSVTGTQDVRNVRTTLHLLTAKCAGDGSCDMDTGRCISGCLEGFDGDDCTLKVMSSITGLLVGGLLGAGALLGVSVLLAAFIIRGRQRPRDSASSDDPNGCQTGVYVPSGDIRTRDNADGDTTESEPQPSGSSESVYTPLEIYENPYLIRTYSVLRIGRGHAANGNTQGDHSAAPYENIEIATN
ncbi:hypothetical protein BaRGS_00022183 [Batillaria attramentaria]|uniref:EGF-like domain-containing protein n=1 Tax=Batillaria attramentaria TaxID=370345 RepID=A0ABD0KHW8_9CAEN